MLAHHCAKCRIWHYEGTDHGAQPLGEIRIVGDQLYFYPARSDTSTRQGGE